MLLFTAGYCAVTMLVVAILAGPTQTRFVQMATATAGMIALIAALLTITRPHEGFLGRTVVAAAPLTVLVCLTGQYLPHGGTAFAAMGAGLFLLASVGIGLRAGPGPPRMLHPPKAALLIAPAGACGIAAVVLQVEDASPEVLNVLLEVAIIGVLAGLDHAAVERLWGRRMPPRAAFAAHLLFCGVLATVGAFGADNVVLGLGVAAVTVGVVWTALKRGASAIQRWLRW
jgi:hypothetical protein